jgi:hypothetical protein
MRGVYSSVAYYWTQFLAIYRGYLHLKLFAVLQSFIYFFHNFSRKILRCCAELWSGNTVLTSE